MTFHSATFIGSESFVKESKSYLKRHNLNPEFLERKKSIFQIEFLMENRLPPIVYSAIADVVFCNIFHFFFLFSFV